MIELAVFIEGLGKGLWKVKVMNDWALQNTVENSRETDIYFFPVIPIGFE